MYQLERNFHETLSYHVREAQGRPVQGPKNSGGSQLHLPPGFTEAKKHGPQNKRAAPRPKRRGSVFHHPAWLAARRQLALGTRSRENCPGEPTAAPCDKQGPRQPHPASPLAKARAQGERALRARACWASRGWQEPTSAPGLLCVPFSTSVCLTVKWTG